MLWTIWFSLVFSIVGYQVKLGGGWLRGNDARSPFEGPFLWLCIAYLLGAAVVRWLLIPKSQDLKRLLVLMIIGLALSETVVFHGIFLFPPDMPATKMGLFLLSFVSAFQFVPIYAKEPAQEG